MKTTTELLQYTVFDQGGNPEPVAVEFTGYKAVVYRGKIELISGPIVLGRIIPELGIRVDRVESEVDPSHAQDAAYEEYVRSEYEAGEAHYHTGEWVS